MEEDSSRTTTRRREGNIGDYKIKSFGDYMRPDIVNALVTWLQEPSLSRQGRLLLAASSRNLALLFGRKLKPRLNGEPSRFALLWPTFKVSACCVYARISCPRMCCNCSCIPSHRRWWFPCTRWPVPTQRKRGLSTKPRIK